ncbi:LamG domain-containing protein [Streptomyces sannanensis]
MANPDGTYTLTQSTTPQRARVEDGSWRSVDVTLERRADGSIGPKAAVVDLAFSDGGSGTDLIRLGNSKGSLELGWPAALPEPVLDGATATYPEVFEGVDLRLTATAEGYREVLVVKTAEAAANPELNQVTLTASGDGLDIVSGAGGGLRALDADGNAVFTGPAGQMWDSAGDDADAQTQLRRAAPGTGTGPGGEDGSVRPGQGDATAELPVQVSGNAITVRPDPKLLRGKDTVYPVFIDPPMGLSLQERTVLSSDGTRLWNFDGDEGVGNCSHLGPWYCGSDYTKRMYFEFAPTNLAGKHVLYAEFAAYETWSFSCTPHGVGLWRTNNISENTSWPGPARLDLMDSVSVSAGRGDYCSPSRPDQWVEFADPTLTSTVRSFADGKFPRLTLMLAASNESDPDAWKRFDDNATLRIDYVPKPGVPSPYGVIPGDGTTPFCATDYRDPTIVTRADPMVVGHVQTSVQPPSNGFKGSLRAFFQAQRSDTTTNTWVNTWNTTVPDTGYYSDGSKASERMTPRSDNTLYRVAVLTQSYYSQGGVTSWLSSPYTRWCYFKTDFAAPKAPVITSKGPYTQCTATSCVGMGGPGQAGEFEIKPNAVDTDVTEYRWRLLTETSAKTQTGSVVTIRPTPTIGGTQVLVVEAKDVRSRWGEPSEFIFKVAPGAGAVGRWQFADATPGATTAKDTATEGSVRHDATLVGGAEGSARARRGAGDLSLGLAGTDPAEQQAYASTGTPAVNTKDSFTVSAWAYLNDSSTTQAVLSAPGTTDTAFTLYYSSGHKRWAFNRGTQDKSTTPDVVVLGNTLNPPVRVWTHLAAVFDTKGDVDKTNDTIQLFVNGRPQGGPVTLSSKATEYEPWTSSEGTQIGRTKLSGTFQQHFRGYLDEVAVWQTALTAEQVRVDSGLEEDAVAATELVADWDASLATGTEMADRSGYLQPGLKLSTEGAQLSTSADGNKSLTLDGAKGYVSATGPVMDETGSFTVSATVQLDKAALDTKPIGYRAQIFAQSTAVGSESSWALWVEKLSADGYLWRFGRTATDATGKVLETASVPSQEPAALDTWVHVTGVFDAGEATGTGFGSTHLFVNQAEQPQEDMSSFNSAAQGAGALSAGRGSAAGTTGYYLPGALQQLRMWTGAMKADQVNAKVLGNPGNE